MTTCETRDLLSCSSLTHQASRMAQDRTALRLQELKAQQDRWMRERQAELEREKVLSEMQGQAQGLCQLAGSARARLRAS